MGRGNSNGSGVISKKITPDPFAVSALAAIVCGVIGFVRSGNRQLRSILGITLPMAAFFFGCLCVMIAAMSG
jgi:hypothetical protein